MILPNQDQPAHAIITKVIDNNTATLTCYEHHAVFTTQTNNGDPICITNRPGPAYWAKDTAGQNTYYRLTDIHGDHNLVIGHVITNAIHEHLMVWLRTPIDKTGAMLAWHVIMSMNTAAHNCLSQLEAFTAKAKAHNQ